MLFVSANNCKVMARRPLWVPRHLLFLGFVWTMGEKDGLFFVVELQLTDGSAFDAMMAGTFVDMFGREVTFKDEDIPTYYENTRAAIEASKTEKGEVVGLPIDAYGHDKGDGAGWIIGVEMGELPDSGTPILRVTPKWTAIGRELIEEGVRRFFSPTIDIKEKVVLGGTLTNWPAMRAPNGQIRLRPIELSQNMSAFQTVVEEGESNDTGQSTPQKRDDKTTEVIKMDMTKEELAELIGAQVREQLRTAINESLKDVDGDENGEDEGGDALDILQLLEMEETKQGVVEAYRTAMQSQFEALRERALREATLMIGRVRRENTIAEFSERVTGGTTDVPRGLPVPQDDLQKWLLTLNSEQLEFAQNLLTDVHEKGLIEFEGMGHQKKMKGTRELPEPYSRLLKGFVDSGGTVKEFFAANPEVGNQSEFNLEEIKNG